MTRHPLVPIAAIALVSFAGLVIGLTGDGWEDASPRWASPCPWRRSPWRCCAAEDPASFVIARGEAPRQSRAVRAALDCFATLAMTKRGSGVPLYPKRCLPPTTVRST
jgi:hypothetical protein